MKKLIIAALLGIVSVSVVAQNKRDTVYITVHDTVPYFGSGLTFIKSDCRDSTIRRSRQVALLIMTSFGKNNYEWRSAWQCWDEKIQVGKDCYSFVSYDNQSNRKYTYLMPDRKTIIRSKVIDWRIIE